jgi:DivIVA domain-containing protein
MYTPEQLAEITFGKKFGGGYNTEDVDSVFKQLTEDYTNLYNESISLKTKMRVIVAKLEEYRNAEERMKQAVIDTKKSCETMVAETEVKCAGMIRDAEAAAREADIKIAHEEARVEDARQEATRQIMDIQSRLESCQKILEQLRQDHKPEGPIEEASQVQEKPAPQRTLPPLMTESSSDMFSNLQFGRNYDTNKKR